MSYNKGSILNVLDAMKTWIEAELTLRSYSTYRVTTDYTIPVTQVAVVPYVSIRLDRDTSDEALYGRTVSGSTEASTTEYKLTLHVYHDRGTGTHELEPVLLVAEYISNMLQELNESKATIFAKGIFAIRGISSRVSSLRVRDRRRVIVEAFIDVLLEDI